MSSSVSPNPTYLSSIYEHTTKLAGGENEIKYGMIRIALTPFQVQKEVALENQEAVQPLSHKLQYELTSAN